MRIMHQDQSDRIHNGQLGSMPTDYDREDDPIPSLSKSLSFANVGSFAGGFMEHSLEKKEDARPLLPRAAFFIGDLRDGLPMLNMQAMFLMCSKNFDEKQIGLLFLVFGLSQFICMTPAGYFLDYSNHKIDWVNWSGLIVTTLTVATVILAQDGGTNMGLMILLKILQGGASAVLPPGFNSVTLGIVGSTGFTLQVAKNRTMNHVGTALIVAVGSLIAYFLYPNIGALFIVSPLTMIGVYYNMVRIKPNHVDRDAARALIIESPTMTEYEHLDTETLSYEGSDYIAAGTTSSSDSSNDDNSYIGPPQNMISFRVQSGSNDFAQYNAAKSQELVQLGQSDFVPTKTASNNSMPSFRIGWGGNGNKIEVHQPRTPLAVLLDPTLVLFTLIVFCFHMANSSVLPLVMQSLAVEDEQSGIILSGMCIFLGQGFMSYFAKLCGDYSPKWGRKGLTLVALSSLTIRCLALTLLMTAKDQLQKEFGSIVVKALIVSTQLLDSVGAGIFGTMHIIVTNDISTRSGRFSLMMGITSSAMCLGATVSSYIGQSIAHDHGYPMAFTWLGALSLVPLLLYMFLMPETLPDYVRPESRKRRLVAILKKLNEKRRKLFRRKRKQKIPKQLEVDGEQHDGLTNDDNTTSNKPNMEFV